MRTSTAARPVPTCRVDRGTVCLSTGTDASPRRAFTLVELLVVMGIVGVLAVIVGLGVSKAATGARIAAATNDVIAALAQARAIAVRDRTDTVVAFRVYQPTLPGTPSLPERPDFSKPQQVEIVLAKATGRVLAVANASATNGSIFLQPASEGIGAADVLIEEFIPVEGIQPKRLPVGFKVGVPASELTLFVATTPQYYPAGAGSGDAADMFWLSQPELKNTGECGSMLMVRFGADGKLRTRNPALPGQIVQNQGGGIRPWIDFNRDGRLAIGSTTTSTDTKYYVYDEWSDEPLGNMGLSIAVFDDAAMREYYPPASQLQWRGPGNQRKVLVGDRTIFIDQNADRIEFNRFTGVAEVVPQ